MRGRYKRWVSGKADYLRTKGLCLGLGVGGDQNRFPLGLYQGGALLHQVLIKALERLVQDQGFGFECKGTGKGHAALHSAGHA